LIGDYLEYLVEKKIGRVLEGVKSIGDVDALILTSRSALRYILSELWPPLIIDQLGVPVQAMVLDLRSHTATVYVSAMEYLAFKEKISDIMRTWGIDVVPTSKYLSEVYGTRTVGDIREHLKKVVEGYKIVAVDEMGTILGSVLKERNVIVIKGVINEIRRKKLDEEVERIKRCVEICRIALQRFVESLRPGLTEMQMANMLERYLIEAGAQGIAFNTIVAVGKNTRNPHHVPQPGSVYHSRQPLLIDFGAYVDGYVCDITRVIVPKSVEPMYSETTCMCRVVENAIDRVISSMSVGTPYPDLYKIACSALESYSKYFIHGLGHGLGVEVHEHPYITPTSEDRVELNDVVTIEPGIYLESVGVRIEDDVAITARGVEVLSRDIPRVIEV